MTVFEYGEAHDPHRCRASSFPRVGAARGRPRAARLRATSPSTPTDPRGRHPDARPRGSHRRRCRTSSARSGAAEVWGTRLTLGLVKSKLDEHGLLVHTDLARSSRRAAVVRSGPFEAEFVRVTHSIPDAVAVVLHTRARHNRPHRRLQARPDAGRRPDDRPRPPRASSARPASRCSWPTRRTPSGRARTPRSGRWARRCATSSAERPGRVIVTSFASHIHRIQQVIDAAAACGRTASAWSAGR